MTLRNPFEIHEEIALTTKVLAELLAQHRLPGVVEVDHDDWNIYLRRSDGNEIHYGPGTIPNKNFHWPRTDS